MAFLAFNKLRLRWFLTALPVAIVATCLVALLVVQTDTVVAQDKTKLTRGAVELLAKRKLPAQWVRGYIAVAVGSTGEAESAGMFSHNVPNQRIYLPGVDVFLVDSRTGVSTDMSRTDLSGRFSIAAAAKARYQLCWKSDVYGSDCARDLVSVSASPVFLSSIILRFPRIDGMTNLMGKLTTADGTTVRMFEPLFGVNSFATIEAVNAKGTSLGKVYVNNFGDYFIPNMPVKNDFAIIASVEGAVAKQAVSSEARLDSGPIHQLNLRTENSRPSLDPMRATLTTGERAQVISGGEDIVLTTNGRDRDGDKLQFLWQVDEGSGKLDRTDGARVVWSTPSEPGRYGVSVIAYDGKGGYDKSDFRFAVGEKGVRFSGTVVDQLGAAVDGAEVEIVGTAPTLTTADGGFEMLASPADKYVFNIRKTGFALNSQIFLQANMGGRHTLRAGQVVQIDPTIDMVITNGDRGKLDCVGPKSALLARRLEKTSILKPQWQDGAGNIVDAPSGKDDGFRGDSFKGDTRAILPTEVVSDGCGPGISVVLPANSIVDENGKDVTTPFDVTISTVDLLSPEQMPGDGTTRASDGAIKAIESFGAGALDLPRGMQLRPGATAELTIPVDRSRLAGGSMPPRVPLLSYDEVKGEWVEDGEMDLVTLNGVPSYVAKVSHFTSFNADTLFENNACIRIFSPTLPDSYNLEMIAPNPDGTPHAKNLSINGNTAAPEHLLYNLVPNRNLTLAPSTVGANPQLLGFYVVNSGAAIPNAGNPGPGNVPPASACGNFVVLKTGVAPDSSFGGEFLNGLGFLNAGNLGFANDLDTAAPGSNTLANAIIQASKNYYTTVNPGGLRTTLADFKTLWGFGTDPNEITASYANSGDLGFGRDMHCLKKTNGNVACYVTNYGDGYKNGSPAPGTNDQTDANDAGAQNATAEVATVAMEYAPIGGDPKAAGNTVNPIVKFYVYKKGLGNTLSISANLDGRGERPVPQLCMVCHGGLTPQQANSAAPFSTAADVSLDSRFIPFDHRFFSFPNNNASLTKAAQEAKFKDLNEIIVKFAPPRPATDPVVELIAELYKDNAGNPVNAQNSVAVVPGWKSTAPGAFANQQNTYQNVVGTGCRSCHVTQKFAQLQFNTSQKFVDLNVAGFPNNKLMLGTVQERVCGDYIMPHALRTHELFWDTNGSTPLLMYSALQNFGNGIGSSTWKPGLCTSFIPNNTATPSNFYQRVLQPLWNGKCVECHIAGGQASFLQLTDGNSFTNLRNGYVTPFDDTTGTLLNKITSTGPQSSRMPKNCFRAGEFDNGNPCLSQVDIDTLKAWIRSGAN